MCRKSRAAAAAARRRHETKPGSAVSLLTTRAVLVSCMCMSDTLATAGVVLSWLLATVLWGAAWAGLLAALLLPAVRQVPPQSAAVAVATTVGAVAASHAGAVATAVTAVHCAQVVPTWGLPQTWWLV